MYPRSNFFPPFDDHPLTGPPGSPITRPMATATTKHTTNAAQTLVTESELAAILTNAQAANDPYTIAEVARARRGDAMAQLACAMILGR